MKKALITGGCGFIGSHLAERLLEEGNWEVTCLDNLDPFYDPAIKMSNINHVIHKELYKYVQGDLQQLDMLDARLDANYDVIVHLAAKAGVRPSIEDPIAYNKTNVDGTQRLLEWAKTRGIKQFVFGSSSSVYGINPNVPWREDDHVLNPISPYASTKVSGELLGHVYSALYGIRFVALRFFTVYGPRQRPDLAIHKFTRHLYEDRPIPKFGSGETRRDYTYVADIVEGIRAAMDYDRTLFEVINLGNHDSVTLNELIRILEEATGKKATIEQFGEQPGDVPQTYADISKAKHLLGYLPHTDIRTGIKKFVEWYAMEREAVHYAT
ncbi:NAD-dependent epimerase/dehydratase family protein [Cohnella sp. 56]|uniref:NAD-dependent epimerase/dehydratase family protein n=1 Tax=Cohnella sp. 56 TaxID=3113722 RepID=UPI0030E7B72F